MLLGYRPMEWFLETTTTWRTPWILRTCFVNHSSHIYTPSCILELPYYELPFLSTELGEDYSERE
jgi:hypothetical protein